MVCLRLALLVTIVVLAATTTAPAQPPPTQLDRIEQKLDTLLQQLDQRRLDQPAAAQSSGSPSGAGQTTSPTAGGSALPSPSAALTGGALAIIHAAPSTPLAAH